LINRLEKDRTELSIYPPKIIILIAGFFLVCALLITPELLSAIGMMRRSLHSEILSVRNTALLTVKAFKIMCWILAAVCAFSVIFWKRIRKSAVIRKISEHQAFVNFQPFRMASLLNFSFAVITLVTISGLLCVGLGGHFTDTATLTWISREDGLIEQITAFIFLVCSLLSAHTAIKVHSRYRRIVFGLFAIGFFLCFGEEISWGQRILGFETPEAFQEYNVQNEFNLHNLGGYLIDHMFIAGVFLYGFIFPLLTWKHPFWHNLFDKFGIPISSVGLAVGFLIISMLHDWTVYRILPETVFSIGELREMVASIGFLLLIIESRKMLTLTKRVVVPG
jgi:hypothetical protein